jgi:hypothetical protein
MKVRHIKRRHYPTYARRLTSTYALRQSLGKLSKFARKNLHFRNYWRQQSWKIREKYIPWNMTNHKNVHARKRRIIR